MALRVETEETAAADLPRQSGTTLLAAYQEVRSFTERLCAPLEVEDYVIQSMPDCSPTKWHLAHVSWFFETFVLRPNVPDYQTLHPRYTYLFNSYYETIGERHCRPKRGLISRPTVKETYAYRAYVDDRMAHLIGEASEAQIEAIAPVMTLGLHHEQQHQELIVTDLKHMLAENPLHPAYVQSDERPVRPNGPAEPIRWQWHPGGLHWIGCEGDGFCFDNETPRHRQYLQPFGLGSRLVTCGEYLEFMQDGGYGRPDLWLSAGWHTVTEQEWNAPLYWERQDDGWWQMTLGGFRRVAEGEPVCHISYFEADAYARWAGARLPTEGEWEVTAGALPERGNLADSGIFHPTQGFEGQGGLAQMYGDVWEWTQSAYSPYPGFRPAAGAIGEYNGKFMCNQYVLRGGSCATPAGHIRPTYRNFFPPEARWQFSGIRLAKDA